MKRKWYIGALLAGSTAYVMAQSIAGSGGLKHSKPITPIGQKESTKESKPKEKAWFPASITILSVGSTNLLWEVPEADTREMVLKSGQKFVSGARITLQRIVDDMPVPEAFKIMTVSSNTVTLGKATGFEQKTVPLIVKK